MRLDVLRLLAFGPFTDLVVDLSRCPSGLHVLYGDNEAGKSTTLRAVRGLLYGIPHVTLDAHRHRTTELRVGARLVAADGSSLEIVRRKGNTKTLLDPAGAPMDEASLRRLLAGVDEDTFANVFGLDHEALRRGADALLGDRGDVGESLFEAGSGVGGLHRLLEELREQADKLWTPQAHKRPLNEALHAFGEARKATRADALSHEAWTAQERGLADRRAEHARVDAERHALELRRRWLERAQRVRPFLAIRREALTERAALEPVVHLADGAADEHRDAAQALLASRSALQVVDERLGELDRKLETLAEGAVSEAVAVPEGTAQRLAELAVRRRTLLEEQSRRCGELGHLEEEARQRSDRLGASAAAPRLDLTLQAGLRALAAEGRVLRERSGELERRLADAERRVRSLDERHAELGAPRDLVALESVLAGARRQGDLTARLEPARAERDRLQTAARAAAAQLGPWQGRPEHAAGLRRPDLQTIDRFSADRDELDRAASSLAADAARASASAASVAEQIAALEGEGHVPSEADLLAARAARAESWERVRAAWKKGDRKSEVSIAPVHERRERDADELADRLRREATRVSRLAGLRAELGAAQGELEAYRRATEALSARRAEHDADWSRAWAAAGFAPLPPAEMRAWCARHDRLLDGLQALAEADRTVRTLEERAAAIAAELAAALAVGALPGGLPALTEAAAALVDDERSRARRRETIDETRADARAEREIVADEHARHLSALESWSRQWAEAVAVLGLGGDTSIGPALEVLEALRDLWDKQDDVRSRRRALDETAGATRDVDDELRAALSGHAPDLEGLGLDDAVPRLVERLQAGEARALQRTTLQLERSEREAERQAAHAGATAAQVRLQALQQAAGVADLAALEDAERRWSRAVELDRRIAESVANLAAAGEGASVEDLEATFGDLDADRVAVELDEIEDATEELAQRAKELAREVGGLEVGLERLREPAGVVWKAEDAQAHLARIRELATRWAQLRLSTVVLEREIEAYRERNQGPVLSRASELFRTLTAPDYQAVRAGWSAERQDRLQCVRADGEVLEVDGLSDGIRDALYLSLRLASVERLLDVAEPMPLVLDDVLIHMDDRHVRAALLALAAVAARTQVLFFTHNEHIVPIARAVLGDDRVCVHRLVRTERASATAAP